MQEQQPDAVPRVEKTEDDYIAEAMHELPYGIYVIGSSRDGKPNAMIADWVMQVSFDPRLLAVAFENDSSSLARIRDNEVFSVNLLSQEDNGMALASQFVQPANAAKVKGRSEEAASRQYDKLEGVEYRTTDRGGCPILEDALVWIECQADQFLPVGDHTLVIGRVLAAEVQGEGDPLTSTFTGWTYSG